MNLDKYIDQDSTSQQFAKELAVRKIKEVTDIEELRGLTLYLWDEILEAQKMLKRLMLKNIHQGFDQDIIDRVEMPRIDTCDELDKRTE